MDISWVVIGWWALKGTMALALMLGLCWVLDRVSRGSRWFREGAREQRELLKARREQVQVQTQLLKKRL